MIWHNELSNTGGSGAQLSANCVFLLAVLGWVVCAMVFCIGGLKLIMPNAFREEVRTYAYMHIRIHTHSHIQRTHTHTHTHTHIYIYILTHIHRRTYTRTQEWSNDQIVKWKNVIRNLHRLFHIYSILLICIFLYFISLLFIYFFVF